jgi:hypothetical protein
VLFVAVCRAITLDRQKWVLALFLQFNSSSSYSIQFKSEYWFNNVFVIWKQQVLTSMFLSYGGRSNRMLCDSCSVWGVGSIVNNLPLFVSLDLLVLTRLAVWATKPNRYSSRVSKIIQLFSDKFVDYLYRLD